MYIFVERGMGEIRDGCPTLPELQQMVGGYIEGITLGYSTNRRSVRAYCNEEGKIRKGFLPNVYVPALQDIIMGNLVIVAQDKEGDTVPMTQDEVDRLYIQPPVLSFMGAGAFEAYAGSDEDYEEEQRLDAEDESDKLDDEERDLEEGEY